MVRLLTSDAYTHRHSINWGWAETAVQQLLQYALVAAIANPSPDSSPEVLAVAKLRKAAGCDGTISSSSDSGTLQRHIADIIEVPLLLISPAAKIAATYKKGETYRRADLWCRFLANPAVADFTLQLLASRCLLMHKQRVQHQMEQQQQQGQALMRQLGKRIRGDLLLLADPRDQLLPLLPSNEFLAADAAAALGAGDSSCGIDNICSGLTALRISIGNVDESSSRNHPVLSAAALQLSLQLLRVAAAYWQQHYYSLSEQQQTLLSLSAAAVSRDRFEELLQLKVQLAPAQQLFKCCLELLHVQLLTLWGTGQWQPQLQLLQQGGGEMLLQGLTLAVHCGSLHRQMGTLDIFSVLGLAEFVYYSVAGADGCSVRHENIKPCACFRPCAKK
jgi:hypothetical protein